MRYKYCKYCKKKYFKKKVTSRKEWEKSKFCSNFCRDKGRIPPRLGTKTSIETRKKQSEIRLRKKEKQGWLVSQESRKKISSTMKGKIPKNLDYLHKYYCTGPNNFNWKGGITPINKKIRKSLEFKMWRNLVFQRDNWTCQICGQRGGILHPDHIKPFAYFPELRFDVNNGRTLCVDCHRKTPTWGNRVNYYYKGNITT